MVSILELQQQISSSVTLTGLGTPTGMVADQLEAAIASLIPAEYTAANAADTAGSWDRTGWVVSIVSADFKDCVSGQC